MEEIKIKNPRILLDQHPGPLSETRKNDKNSYNERGVIIEVTNEFEFYVRYVGVVWNLNIKAERPINLETRKN